MKIACLTPSKIPAGTANSIQAVKAAHALAVLGHDVRLYHPADSGVSWDELIDPYELSVRFELCPIRSSPRFKRYDFIWQSVTDAAKWQADMIYTWLPQAAWLGGKRGMSAVLELHDRLTGLAGPLFFRWFLGLKKKRLLVITKALQKKLEKQLKETIHPDVVRVAPNGVDLERYRGLPEAAGARALLDLPERFTAVYTGHFYAGRGMELLLKLAAELPDVAFLWVGGKPDDVADWQARVDAAGLRNVTLTGFVPKMKLPLYQAAGDVLLMPYETAIAGSSGGNSAEICSPMKMFDYMATGRVIIASELAVLHEVLNYGNAVFCPPNNAASWANTIRTLQADPEQARLLAAQAREDAARYTWTGRAKTALEGLEPEQE